MFQRATRKKAKLRLALIGPSGSGKTYSALLIAKGLTHADGGKIAMVDTERGSGELYAETKGMPDYDVCPLEPPFTPEKYISAIKGAEAAGYKVLIIDSATHAWAGEGGILDIHSNAAQSAKSANSFAAWRDVTPKHERFVNAILGSTMHVIVTVRTKTAYEIVEDERGKKTPKRIGLAPIQRAGLEYEFTSVLDLAMDSHIASASKDRTGLFDGQNFMIDERTGHDLREWLETGVEAPPKADPYASFRAAIVAATTMTELVAVWRDIPGEARVHCVDDKDARKAALEAPSPVPSDEAV